MAKVKWNYSKTTWIISTNVIVAQIYKQGEKL